MDCNMRIAITRAVSPGFEHCQLTHLERATIDLDLAHLQHRTFEDCLVELGCQVHRLPTSPDLPDSVFIEDIAVVLKGAAVITRPGAVSRRPEVPAVVEALERFRTLLYIEPPGTLDGGDVLLLGKQLFVGISGRTNEAGVEQLRSLVGPLGYAVTGVLVHGCLHLKSAVTQVAAGALLINPDWVDAACFPGWQLIEIDPSEPFAANALLIEGCLVYPAAFPLTLARLERAGIQVMPVDVSEIAKAEGGVTCCSLVFEV
jgi:dimethylargininase